jgi:hypothetical protein
VHVPNDDKGNPAPTPQMKQFIGVITSVTVEGSRIDDDVDALAGAYHPLVNRAPTYRGLGKGLSDRIAADRARRFRF